MNEAELEQRLTAFESILRRWAPRLNLIAEGDVARLRERHLEDCLRLAPLSDELPAGTAIDVGSGAGLPGIVLALARPSRSWRLLEPRPKRAAFLDEAVRELALANVEVHSLTAEKAAANPIFRSAHVLAVARAVAPPLQSLRLVTPLVGPGGAAAVFAGKTAPRPPGAEEWAPGIIVQRVPSVR